MYIPHKLDIIR